MEENVRAKIIAKCWKDPSFKQKLLKDPRSAFKECGVELPSDVNIKVAEDTEKNYNFVIPFQSFATKELSEKELIDIAGGDCCASLTIPGHTF